MTTALSNIVHRETAELCVLPPTRGGRITLLVLLLIAIFLRTAGLDWGLSYEVNQASAHHDEVHKIVMLLKDNETFSKDFGEWEISRPVFFLRVFARPLILLGEKLGINSDRNLVFEHAVARGVNGALGIIGIVLLYLLATKLAGPQAGLWAVALLTFLPGHWYYSQNIKFDLSVGSYGIFIILASIMLYERGTWFWYIVTGAGIGIAVATKASALPLVPIPLFAHLLRLVVVRPAWSTFFRQTLVTPVVAAGVFFMFYPYPFLDFNRWLHFVLYPTDALRLHADISPQIFLRTWNLYNLPQRPLMEMAYGLVVAKLFPLAALIFFLQTLWFTLRRQGVPYLLTLATGLLLYHSLSFWIATGTRFLLPLAPLIVLALALIFELFPLTTSRWNALRWATRAFGIVVVGATLVYTWAIFPIFAFGDDVRIQVIHYLESRVGPHDVVGEFEPNGRQSVPFDNEKVRTVEMRTHGEDPHIFLTSRPEYLVYQVEPWNDDDAIRPQLYTPTIRDEFFNQYLQSYQLLGRFGKEPTLRGRKLPRTIGMPVYEVYQRRPAREAPLKNDPRPQPVSPQQPLRQRAPALWRPDDLQGKIVTATIDLTAIKQHWNEDQPWDGTLSLVFLLDNATFIDDLPNKISEPDIRGSEKQWELVMPLNRETVTHSTATVKVFFRENGLYEFSTGSGEQLVGRNMAKKPEFSTAELLLAVNSRQNTSLPVVVREFSVTTEADRLVH